MILWVVNHVSIDGVSGQVARCREEISVVVDHRVVEPAAEHRAFEAMDRNHVLSESGIEMAHCPAEVSLDASNQQVIVVGHQAVGVNLLTKSFLGFAEQRQKVVRIKRASKQRVVSVRVGSDVMPRTGVVESGFPGHGLSMTKPCDIGGCPDGV